MMVGQLTDIRISFFRWRPCPFSETGELNSGNVFMVDCLTDDASRTANRLVLETLHRKWRWKTTAEHGGTAENLQQDRRRHQPT